MVWFQGIIYIKIKALKLKHRANYKLSGFAYGRKRSASANRQYLGKIVAVQGKIKIHREEEDYHSSIRLETGSMSSVHCNYGYSTLDEVTPLKKGQLINIKGIYAMAVKDELATLMSF